MIDRRTMARLVPSSGLLGVIGIGAVSGACVVDEIPACPGRCFEFTVAHEIPVPCLTEDGYGIDIPFNDLEQTGYRGEHCFNSSAVPLVIEAIDHLGSGARLSDLELSLRLAYQGTVDAITADIEAQCNAAAAAQCTNAAQVCEGIAAEAYRQLLVEESCVLTVGGVEAVVLAPGGVCEPILDGAVATGGEEHCTSGDDGADTSAGSDGADESTGAMLTPFGDLETLVSCDADLRCELDPELLRLVTAHFEVFAADRAALVLVDREVPCGPGARLDGLDQGEPSTALAEALGLRRSDVIAQVDDIAIQGLPDAMAAVTALLDSSAATLVVRRPEARGCSTFTLEIERL